VTRDPPTKPPQLPIPKPAKSPQLLESRVRPGCETLTISAGADAVLLYAHAANWPGFATPRWPAFPPPLTAPNNLYVMPFVGFCEAA
jgi:hypothetical protein